MPPLREGPGDAVREQSTALPVFTTRLDLDRIRAARRVIDPIFLDTPLYECDALGRELGCAVSIKLETANPVHSFKARGTELVASLLTDQGRTAAVCASAGNLGQALGWSGHRRGLDVTVVASRRAPAVKLDRIRALGAELELVDGDFEMARERAASIAQRRGVRLLEDSLDHRDLRGDGDHRSGAGERGFFFGRCPDRPGWRRAGHRRGLRPEDAFAGRRAGRPAR